jgi:hypothetical protein
MDGFSESAAVVFMHMSVFFRGRFCLQASHGVPRPRHQAVQSLTAAALTAQRLHLNAPRDTFRCHIHIMLSHPQEQKAIPNAPTCTDSSSSSRMCSAQLPSHLCTRVHLSHEGSGCKRHMACHVPADQEVHYSKHHQLLADARPSASFLHLPCVTITYNIKKNRRQYQLHLPALTADPAVGCSSASICHLPFS